jgi:hypothetical protein
LRVPREDERKKEVARKASMCS